MPTRSRSASADADRGGRGAEEGEGGVDDRVAGEFDLGDEADERVVAVPAGDLDDRPDRAGGPGGKRHAGEDLVGAQRGLEISLEEVGRRDRPFTGHRGGGHRRSDGEGHRWHLGRGIGVRDRADDRASGADRPVRDERHGAVDERRVRGDLGGALGRGVPDQRADGARPVGADLDGVEPGHTTDVDHHGGTSHAHRHEGHERLTARQHLGVVAVFREQGQRLGECVGTVVTERRRLHPSMFARRRSRRSLGRPRPRSDGSTGRQRSAMSNASARPRSIQADSSGTT